LDINIPIFNEVLQQIKADSSLKKTSNYANYLSNQTDIAKAKKQLQRLHKKPLEIEEF
jgi:hypothetical protein